MKFVITKPRPKTTGDNSTTDEPQNWAIAPTRGNGKNPEQRRPDLEDLQRRGVLPPVISVNGRLVVQKQKIVILSLDEIKKLKGARIGAKRVTFKVVRISDCSNPDGEYKRPTYTALLEFNELTARKVAQDQFSREEVNETEQANNFVLSGELPGSKPSPPIQDGEATEAMDNSDFQAADVTDIEQYPEQSKAVVAVVDSGVKFDLANRPQTGLYQYTNRKGIKGKLRLVRGKAICEIEQAGIGYCGVGSYLNPPKPIPSAMHVFSSLNSQQIMASAFDDAPGRHGTYVTSIINQESPDSVGVLPVKAFNWGGFGTLFDLLATLNYVLEQKRSGVPILVLNASWVGSVDEDGRKLLLSKFKQVEQAGIIVVAAAGNQGRDLRSLMLYPACFSTELSNVITVTSVEPTFRPTLLGGAADQISDLITADGKDNILDHLGLNSTLFDLLLRGYKAVGNYSAKYVSVGVFGRRWSGYSSPFHREGSLPARTSYAAAYVSGQVASYLLDRGVTPTTDTIAGLRDTILQDLTTKEQSLARTIQQGRFLKVKP